jgi:hypothetical protein
VRTAEAVTEATPPRSSFDPFACPVLQLARTSGIAGVSTLEQKSGAQRPSDFHFRML